jgi:uncharacterized protein
VTVDAHVHLLPTRLGEAIRRFFADNGYGHDTWRYPLDHAEVTERLASEGVTQAWSLPYARRPGTAPGLNQASAETAAALSGGPVEVVGGATVHPGDVDPAGIVRTGVEECGLRVLKLHCSVGDFRPDDARFDPVWAYVSEIRLPVVVHAGHAVGGGTEAAEIEAVRLVAERWPDARVIVAHFGHAAVDETLDLLEACPNTYADLTPVVLHPIPLPADRLATIADRVLFGSDAPNTAVTVTELLAHLDGLGLDADAIAGIREGNARRLQAEIRA